VISPSAALAVWVVVWRLTKGHRLRPWNSPYLKWRIETYWGTPAESMGGADVRRFVWQHRRELLGFLRWAGEMHRQGGGRPRPRQTPRSG